MERIAAVDLGTNSIRLAVADVLEDHTLSIVRESKEVIRLGGGETGGNLAEDAIQRAETACKGFADVARKMEADPIVAVATSAIREARNRDAVLDRLRAASGLDLHVISGEEEGRLIHLGVVHNESLPPGNVSVIDIGGGSVEVTCGDRDGADVVESFKLGAIRTTQAMPPDALGRYSRPRLKRLHDYARNTSLRSVTRVREHGVVTVAGTSGTIQTLAHMTQRNPDKVDKGENLTLRRADLTALISRMAGMTNEERGRLPGINPERADIIVAGAVVLEQVLVGLEQPSLVTSSRTLRDGLLLDHVLRKDAARDTYGTTPVRQRSVQRMLRRFRGEEDHGAAVSRLAESLFDQCRALGWHNYGEEQRELLRYGAMLHDIGIVVSPSAHHKHGHYIVSKVALPGFYQEENDVMAALVLYHRKSLPKPSAPAFNALPAAQQSFVRDVIPILRLADALDRSHCSAVKSVHVAEDAHGMAEVTAHSDDLIPYETWAVDRTMEMTPALFGRPIIFHVSRTK